MTPRLPRPPRLPSVSQRIPGAPAPQRSLKLTAESFQTIPEPPVWWGAHPQTEWAVYYILVLKHGWRVYGSPDPNGPPSPQGVDAWYQAIIPAPGLYQVAGGFRGDYWILPSGKGGSPGPPYGRGVVLDPVTLFTHGTTGMDRLRRDILGQNGYLLVWIDASALDTRPDDVVMKAVRGVDESSISRGIR